MVLIRNFTFFFIITPLLFHLNNPSERQNFIYGINRITIDSLPDFNYTLPPLDSGMNFHHFASLGDVNGDGFDDIGVIVAPQIRNWEKILLVYFGKTNGLSNLPDQIIDVDIPTRSPGIVNGIGDVNGDGYSDVLYSEVIYFGSDTGLSHNYTWRAFKPNNIHETVGFAYYLDGKGYPVGDIDNDGYDDFFLTSRRRGAYHFFKGGSVLSSESSGIHRVIYEDNFDLFAYSAGDVNGDGFNDILFDMVDLYLNPAIYLGNARNFEINPAWSRNSQLLGDEERRVTTADVNGDGYSDILLYLLASNSGNTHEMLITIYGSGSGPDLINPDTLINNYINYYPEGIFMSSIGDINEDGYDDIFLDFQLEGNFPKLIYGSAEGLKIGEADYSFQSYKNLNRAGDINGDGKVDYSAKTENSPWFTLVFSKPDPIDIPLVINCEPELFLCYDSSENYTIPDIRITGNYKEVNFKISGRTKRTGTGTNASGYFKPGESQIIWTIKDNHDQIHTCTTKIIASPPFEVKIKPGYGELSHGEPNHIYIGYGHAGFKLTALTSGGSGPYSYNWTGGGRDRYHAVNHKVAGEYLYSVYVYNKYSCIAIAHTNIIVKDIRCPSEMEVYFKENLPWLYSNSMINAVLKNKIFIQICDNGENKCIDRDSAGALLSSGAKLGSCELQALNIIPFNNSIQNEINADELKLSAFPNPAKNYFNLKIHSAPGGLIEINIIDVSGRTMESYQHQSGVFNIKVGTGLRAGFYWVEIKTATERKLLKLIKLN